VVFCGLFPVDAAEFETCAPPWASCASTTQLSYEMETSAALGFGFRCGFLGLLHLEIIQERLEREFDLDLITTAPASSMTSHMTDGEMLELHNPADMPDPMRKIDHIEEPWIEATISRRTNISAHAQALPGPARHPEEPDLCRRARHAVTYDCR
jgi:GTP-binding protein LepA